MVQTDPGTYDQVVDSLRPDSNGRRDFRKFKQILTTWSRTREVALGRKWLELDRREYSKHWKGRGRKKKTIKNVQKSHETRHVS